MEGPNKIKKESEKSSLEKVDWIYEKKGHDAEEYLMGKRFDGLKEEEEETAINPAPGFDDAIAKRAELDMKLKMREDPLYAIKLKEEEARRRIMENPLKLKKLQKLKEAKKQKSKNSHKDKSHKKDKTKKSEKNDESSDEETKKLFKKFLELKKKQTSKGGGERGGSSESEEARKDFGLNIKRKYPMPEQNNKVDYSKLNFKPPKPSTSRKEKRRLTESEKEERRKKMLADAERT